MEELILTKIIAPPTPRRILPRPRVNARLDELLDFPLTLISAPAGFGKSTAFCEWAEKARTRAEIAWLSLEAADNDAVRCMSYINAALKRAVPGADPGIGAQLESVLPPSPETIATAWVNALSHAERPLVLALNDYHLIETRAIHSALEFLVEHCPPEMHLVLLTRSDPDLPLARWRARGQLHEVRAADLRFTPHEATAWLNERMGLRLSPAQVQALDARTEGWAAGLQLAALSLRGQSDADAFIHAFTGSHRFVVDYLMDQVLERESPEFQTFMLETSLLNRMDASLCNAVTGRRDSEALLRELEQRNLFVVALDEHGQWYRYHQLFAGVLEHRLRRTAPERIPELYARASAWFERQGNDAEAVAYALAAPDYTRAARVIERVGIAMTLAGQAETVYGWLTRLPRELYESSALLALNGAVAGMITDHLAEADEWMRLAEKQATADVPPEVQYAVQGWSAIRTGEFALRRGDLEGCYRVSADALRRLPAGDPASLPLLVRAARSFQFSGNVTPAAEANMAAILESVRATGNLYTLLMAIVYLARMRFWQGRLSDAQRTYALATEAAGAELVIHPGYYFGLADIARERNDLTQARSLIAQGMDLTRRALSVEADVLVLGYETLVRCELAMQAFERAAQAVGQLEKVAQERAFAAPMLAQIEALAAQVLLAQGKPVRAGQWADRVQTVPPEEALWMEGVYLTYARVRRAQAAPANSDLARLLEHMLAHAEQNSRITGVIAILVQSALVRRKRDDHAGARAAISRALALAEPEGFVRVFTDEGAELRALLGAVRSAQPPSLQAYIDALLPAFGGANAAVVPNLYRQVLPEPLSLREIQVLRLVVDGKTNQEIADELIVATSTVKAHTNSIYGKLNVNSRAQAIRRAHELGLV